MLSTASLSTIDKQIARTQADIAKVEARVARAQAVIDAVPSLREELDERMDYLNRVRARRIQELPAAAADGQTPVLNTETETPAADVADEALVPQIESATGGVYSDADPRLTSPV